MLWCGSPSGWIVARSVSRRLEFLPCLFPSSCTLVHTTLFPTKKNIVTFPSTKTKTGMFQTPTWERLLARYVAQSHFEGKADPVVLNTLCWSYCTVCPSRRSQYSESFYFQYLREIEMRAVQNRIADVVLRTRWLGFVGVIHPYLGKAR